MLEQIYIFGHKNPDTDSICSSIVKEKLKVPPTYMIPVFIGIGYADPNEKELEQCFPDIDKQIHFGRWK